MTSGAIFFQNVSFRYSKASTSLFDNLTAHFSAGWTGIVGANGTGKTTILRLATGELEPQRGHIRRPGNAIYCPQRTDRVPSLFPDLMQAVDGDARKIKNMLDISNDWLQRWDTLSHGERKRAQIGVLLWSKASAVAVDEPTNHLDTEARSLLADALRSFRGIGLLVSHDRELLDTLCRQCLFVEPPHGIMRPGGYTEGSRQAKREEEYIAKQHAVVKSAAQRLRRESARRRDSASRSQRRLSKRGLGPGDHDARDKINRARMTGKDSADGKRLRQIQSRLRRVQREQEQFKVKKTYRLGIWLEGSCSKRDTLFHLPEGSIPLGGERELRFPSLTMQPTDRIAITGPNGTGKSTLVRHIMRSLTLPEERVTYLPQEIDVRASKDIMARVRGLPKDTLGHMMTVVSRLGSRPYRLLESAEPSPGEIRKIVLAMGIAHSAHLIVMDEPTNHLDLPSIECLEEALSDCPCGLILVSHDQYFLDRLTERTWHVSRSGRTMNIFTLQELWTSARGNSFREP